MKGMLDKIFHCYGCDMTLERGGESQSIRGFFQPQFSRAKQDLYPEMTHMGMDSPGQYLLLCPAEPEMQVGDTVTVAGTAYLLRRREMLYDRGAALYQWGLCTEKGGADTWPVLS